MNATAGARDPFPSVMVARCANGHQWRVDVTWQPIAWLADGTWDPDRKAPVVRPPYCAQCWARFNTVALHVDLVSLEDARAALPRPKGYPR